MIKIILIVFFNVILMVQIGYAEVPNFKRYVIFGDSLTDVGNYTTSSNNCIYFNAPITNHRQNLDDQHTNTTWANAGRLKNILASNDGGNNYAVAGYTTAQILTAVNSYKLNNRIDADTLYIIWAGTNDVLYAISNKWPDGTVKKTLFDGINNIILSLTTLYNSGARHFLIIGLMDLSQTPMAKYPNQDQSILLGLFPNKKDKLRLQRACSEWNNILFSTRSGANKNLLEIFKNTHPRSHIYIWDPTLLLRDMAKNPINYGFPAYLVFNTKDSKTQDIHYLSSQVTYCGNIAKNADRNPNHYLFYNFIHPTPYAYSIIEYNLMKNATEFI